MEKLPERFIDTVMGSTDLFLFDVDKVILRFENLGEDRATFRWLSKKACQDELQRVSDDLFLDACLLSGSSYLPTFPPLESTNFSNKGFTIREAVGMVNSAGKSVITLCQQHQENPNIQSLDYVDRYKRAVMTVRHHVVLETSGTVRPFDFAHAPKDMHDIIGQRLPEEVYFYISKGLLGPQIPNWLTTQEIRVTLPLGSADSESYRQLVSKQLVPVWAESISLLSSTLHRFYQAKPLSLKFWYEKDSRGTINLKDLPSAKDKVAHWKIKTTALPQTLRNKQVQSSPLLFAVQSLKDTALMDEALSKTDPKDKTKVYFVPYPSCTAFC